MFICNDCLFDGYYNMPSFGKSQGRCEICEVDRACNDIPSSALRPKDKMPEDLIHGTPPTPEMAEAADGFARAFEEAVDQLEAAEAAAPCDHQWDGPRIPFGESGSIGTCSRCGEPAVDLLSLGVEPPSTKS